MVPTPSAPRAPSIHIRCKVKYTIVAATLVLAACTSQEETADHAGAQSDHVRENVTASALASMVSDEQGLAATISRGVGAYEAVSNGSAQQEMVKELMTSLPSGTHQDLGNVAQIGRTQDGDAYVTVNVAGQPLTVAVPRSGSAEHPSKEPERSSHEAASLLLGEQAIKMASDLLSKASLGGRDAGKDTEPSTPSTDSQALE
jgi:hypothetical protein